MSLGLSGTEAGSGQVTQSVCRISRPGHAASCGMETVAAKPIGPALRSCVESVDTERSGQARRTADLRQ
ncbi:hypothetical protein E4U59_004288 [Claviceps monticola]|nr:hypothetical protein E4U59_004288 [Claviceps monticola]